MLVAPENESRSDEMRRYLRFGAEDEALLAALAPHAAPRFHAIATAFYDRIREHAGAHAVLRNEAQVERLIQSLITWMGRFFGAPRDKAYCEKSARIGRAHAEVGLPQRYLLSAMALLQAEFLGIAASAGDDADAARSAVTRAVAFELMLIHDAHVAASGHGPVSGEAIAEVGASLSRLERRYLYAVEHARVLFVGLDTEARVRLFNREAERLTGFAREEVFGAVLAEKLSPEGDDDMGAAAFARAARGDAGAPRQIETLVHTKGGKTRQVSWILSPVSDLTDDVTLFATGYDVTDERELATRMRLAEKLASVGTLAAGLAHEIRNPLNGAKLHLTFLDRGLRRTGAEAAMLDTAAVVGAEIERLGQLVDDFLAFAKPRQLNRRTVSIPGLASRVVDLVSGAAATAGVRLVLDLPATSLSVEADVHALEQVLLNLVVNAVEACGNGAGREVTLRARRLPRSIALEVEDDGPGLDPELPIFDAFFSTKEKGTGLGLAIVHRVVTNHEGTIDVASHPGKTVFRVTLPIFATGDES